MSLFPHYLQVEESSWSSWKDRAVTLRLSSAQLDALDDDGDATAPAQFVLELPDTIVRQVSALRPLSIGDDPWPMPPSPWLHESSAPAPRPRWGEGTNLLTVVASFILGTALVVAGTSSVSTEPETESAPVGIAVHSPKTLDRSIRTRDRVGGFSPRADGATVSVDSLARSRRRF